MTLTMVKLLAVEGGVSSLRAIVGGEVPDGAQITVDVKGGALAVEEEAEKIEAKEEETEVQARARPVKNRAGKRLLETHSRLR